jgi:RsiW-degrading membrane proteinase PrsW (M82 family)
MGVKKAATTAQYTTTFVELESGNRFSFEMKEVNAVNISFGWIIAMATAPGLLLLMWFYHKDVLDPEPLNLVVSSFFRGALFVFPAGLLEGMTGPFLIALSPFFYPFIGIAVIEEGLKWLALKRYILHPACDECYDGIVYGTGVALGFATLENLMYVVGSINPWAVAGWRALLSVPLHGLCGLFMGYEAARQKQTEGGPVRVFSILALPVAAHGAYNLLLFTGTAWGVLSAVGLVGLLWIKAFGTIKRSRTCS